MSAVERITAQLHKARQAQFAAVVDSQEAERRSAAATPGGLTGYDSAVLSGIRRKPNRKADDRRWNAYSKEADLALKVIDLTADVDRLERALMSAKADASRELFMRDELVNAVAVKDSLGWHRVAKVNTKTVSVETGYSWTDRIPFERIIDFREATQ